ncbi:MAG: response regulator [Deltaproteobacteria bacterium]|nr:response regulator [Deltaproteobacteria bacterium]
MPPRTVMVVDPQPDTLGSVRAALDPSSIQVLPARSFHEAIALAGSCDLAALFTALLLPGGNGYDLARRVRETCPDAPIFLVWGEADVVDGVRARASGVTAGVRRPLDVEAVRAQLESALGELAPEDPDAPGDDGPLVEEDLPPANVEFLEPPPSRATFVPLVGSERLATFVPEEEVFPPRAATPDVEVERAVLAVLPETLEGVLAKALLEPGRVRAVFEDAVRRAVAEQLLRPRNGDDPR